MAAKIVSDEMSKVCGIRYRVQVTEQSSHYYQCVVKVKRIWNLRLCCLADFKIMLPGGTWINP